MSKRSKNSLLTPSNNRNTHQAAAIKDELLAMKYTMTGPGTLIYPYDDNYSNSSHNATNLESESAVVEDDDAGKFKSRGRTSIIRRTSKSRPSPNNGGGNDDPGALNLVNNYTDGSFLTYPDYKPWLDHTMLPSAEAKLENEKITNNAYLNKGYFEPPLVSNEYYLARNMIQNTIFLSTENCQRILNDLLNQLSSTYRLRSEQVNRIKFESNTFKLPPRVTLTALKKEAWLRDLANPQIPLLLLATKIPHGVRNKILVDSLCSKFVPMPRAIWFTKCVLHSELLAWRKKISLRQQQLINSASNNSGSNVKTSIPLIQTLENQWLQEWTQQLVEYIQKFSREMTNIVYPEKKHTYTQKLTYLLSYAQTLYIESLLDKSTFLSLTMKFFIEGIPQHLFAEEDDGGEEDEDNSSEVEGEDDNLDMGARSSTTEQQQLDLHMSLNYGQRLVAFTIVKTYWNDILKLDYLCKELSESLLLNYYLISKTTTKKKQQTQQHQHQNHQHHNSQSQFNIGSVGNFGSASSPLGLMGSPMYSNSPSVFASNTPTNNPHANSLSTNQSNSHVNSSSSLSADLKNKLLKTMAETITYLVKYNSNIFIIPNNWPIVGGTLRSILDSSPVTCTQEREEINKQFTLIKYRNESLMLNLSELARPPKYAQQTPAPDTPSITSNKRDGKTCSRRRSNKDVLSIISQLDNLRLNEQLALFLRPSSGNVGGITWRQHLKLVLYWCVTSYRRSYSTSNSILTVCNFLKKIVYFKIENDKKMEFESEILQVIYAIAEEPEHVVVPNRLYVLLNELYQLKLLTISSYLRKLIASGIFYVENEVNVDDRRIVDSHINILKNLPVLNNKQCDSILKKWTIEGYNFNEKFDQGKEIVLTEILPLVQQQQQPPNCDNLDLIKGLPIGVKFLLVNWTTSQVKGLINGSPKLVHMTPVILSRLYEYYSMCDSLTVFFKVILKFILKNDGMVIIYYMDTLRLITRLILKHSKLVMLVDTSDNNELFRLVLTSYKDLIVREPDFFNFREFWKFMSHLVEILNLTTIEFPQSQLSEGVFGQDTTMNLIGNIFSSSVSDDLEELLTFSRKPLEQAEILEITSNLELEIEPSDEMKLLSILLEVDTNVTNEFEIGIVRLLVNLKDLDKDTFFANLKEFLLSEAKVGITFCQKLINYDIIEMSTLANILPLIVSNSESSLSKGATPDQTLVWKFAVDHYFTKNLPHILKRILSGEDLKDNGKYLELLTIKHTSFIVEEFIEKQPLNVVLSHYEKLLGVELQNKSTEDIINLISVIVNEFNLQVCQVILMALPIKDTPIIESMIDVVFDHLHLKFSPHNSYFGDLFDLLDWQVKSKILDYLETMFLTETKFEDDIKISLKLRNGVNLLPVLKDFFKKVTIQSSAGIHTLPALLDLLIQFTSKLLLITEKTTIEEYDTDLYNTLCVFLRILIIHKQSLISIIIQHDEKLILVQKLIEMLNSDYFAGNKCEKLRILLYDLLLILKGGISEVLAEKTNTEIAASTSGSTGTIPQTNSAIQLLPNESIIARRNSGSPTNTTTTAATTIANPSFVQDVFHLPEPTNNNPLEKYIGGDNLKCLLTLDERELLSDSEINYVNGDALEIDSVAEAGYNNNQPLRAAQSGMHLKSFELLYDNGSGINGSCINLLLFQAYTTRQNPP